MPVITDAQIRKLASSSLTFNRGWDYFSRNLVQQLAFNDQKHLITAEVVGGKKYHVAVQLDNNGKILNYSCDCPAHHQYEGACKHVVAVLLHYNHTTPQFSPQLPEVPAVNQTETPSVEQFTHLTPSATVKTETTRKQASQKFLDTLLQLSGAVSKATIRLEVVLYKDPAQYRAPFIELQIGTSRLYVVRKLRELVEAVLYQRELYFGKSFTYQPQRQQFSPPDQAFINLLLEIYRDERSIYAYRSDFDKIPFELKPSQFKRFLEIAAAMEGAKWRTSYHEPLQPIRVVKAVPPVKLRVIQENEVFQLNLEMTEAIVALSSAKDVWLYGGIFYLLPDEAVSTFNAILDTLNQYADRTLPLEPGQTVRFFTAIAPLVQTICPLEIDPAIQKRLQRETLEIALWLDKFETGISVKVRFKYGEFTLNPLEPPTVALPGSKLLIRDQVAEETFLNLIQTAGFEQKEDRFVLRDEVQLYHFLVQALPELVANYEVYRSEDFDRIQLKNPPRINGAVRLNQNSDLLEVSFDTGEIPRNELAGLLAAVREKKKYYRMKNGAFIALDQPEVQSAAKLLAQLGIPGNDLQKELITLPKYRALYLDQALQQYDKGNFTVNTPFQQLIRNIKAPREFDTPLPVNLQPVLRDYQKTGFKWLKALTSYGFGGILADDMGLGKTLQIIALVMSEYPLTKLPSLVIAPTSLVYNWQAEIRKFAPELSVLILDGSKEQRTELLEQLSRQAFVITSYPLIRRDIEELKNFAFAFCFLDEAQHIKNPETINAKSVKQINARHYFAVTGTPIENSLTELWSIFDFIMPGYLYSHHKFQTRFETPIVRKNDPAALEDLGQHIRPFILRRLKKDVLTELPEKIETKVSCELTDLQKKTYLAYLSKARAEFENEISVHGFTKSQIKILALITRLRQICCHPALFLEDFEGGSGKLDLLLELIRDSISGGHRILIFSQFVAMLDLIEQQLSLEGLPLFRIDGQTPPQERLQRVNTFNEGTYDLFLISLKAGGTGLNLTGADTVIHYDPWWNPAVEDQATDRAYRIGQQKVVQVFKLVTQGTIEEKIYHLQQKKKQLVDAVIQPGENFLGKLSVEEIRELFLE